MIAHPLRIFTIAIAAAAVLAAPANAETRKHKQKHKKANAVQVVGAAPGMHRGTDKVPAGPLYFNGGLYLGDDPDPNIRFQLLRDLSGRLGGDSN
jgi:hypothetical protein